jgi:two-component system response regulator RegA
MSDKNTHRRKLLLIEDDRATFTALRGILALRGWDVTVATTVAEAGAALGDPVDAVVLDLMLPDGDGLSILERIRREGRDVPVVVTTGTVDDARVAAVRRLEPAALLHKPILVADLLKAIARAA